MDSWPITFEENSLVFKSTIAYDGTALKNSDPDMLRGRQLV